MFGEKNAKFAEYNTFIDMRLKRIFSAFLLFSIAQCLYAQHGFDSGHLYDFGLPDGEEVGSSLLKAIPFLVIGFIICWATMWRKSKQNSSETSYWGCFGCLSMVVGAAFLLPLLAWVEAIFQSTLTVAIVIGIVVAVVAYIVKLFKNNS